MIFSVSFVFNSITFILNRIIINCNRIYILLTIILRIVEIYNPCLLLGISMVE